ncbi:MAG: polyprenyl synthetase family protein [Candidatus Puniceispirillaceae bacterium]
MNELSTLRNLAYEKTLLSSSIRLIDKNTIQNLIISRLPTHDKPLGRAAAHHFSKPGKMLRAKMAMHGADALQINQIAAIRWAAAVEVLHNASLVHDDICDGDKQRRGNQAVWAKFGRNVALTLGDWLIALSFEFAAEAAEISNTPRLMRILAQHMSRTTAGEAMELEWDSSLDWDAYLTIATDKTAPLLTAPLQGIAVMAGDQHAEQTISAYFRDLGEAYQIGNDIANFNGNDGAKLVAGDLARRAPNAVTLSFVDKLDADERAVFEQWYKSGDIKDLAVWRDRILHSVAIEAASTRMFATLDRAEQKAAHLSVELSDVTTPVQKLIIQACTAACTNPAA